MFFRVETFDGATWRNRAELSEQKSALSLTIIPHSVRIEEQFVGREHVVERARNQRLVAITAVPLQTNKTIALDINNFTDEQETYAEIEGMQLQNDMFDSWVLLN